MPKIIDNPKSKHIRNIEYNNNHRWKCNICNRYYSPTQIKTHNSTNKHFINNIKNKEII